MRFGSLFSGIGGLDLALEAFGHTPAWQAEIDPHARAVLARHWPGVRCYEDVREINHEAPPVDIICGGFPCQDISNAGKRAGIGGERSGLWSEFARIIRVLRPRFVFVENVAALLGRGLDRVLRDLAALGFDAEWETFLASDVGAPHRRDRLFLLAYSDSERVRQLAERDQRRGRGAREAERGDAEPVHDRAQLAEPDGGRRAPRSGAPAGDEERDQPRDGNGTAGLLSDASGAGRKRIGSGESPGPRRTDAAELRAGPLADASGPRRDEPEDTGAGGRDEGARAEAEGRRVGPGRIESQRESGRPLADADGAGRSEQRSSGLLDRERAPRGDDTDRRHRPHRFPPGPAAIAGWDGPQPAIRRSDAWLPGRLRRNDALRLLGNSVCQQQAALALETLSARVASQATEAA